MQEKELLCITKKQANRWKDPAPMAISLFRGKSGGRIFRGVSPHLKGVHCFFTEVAAGINSLEK